MSAEPPRVLLMGAYGQDNLGDEAILEVHLQQLARYQVTVVSTDPVQTSARYGVPSVQTYGAPRRALRAFLDSDVVVYGGGSLVKELPPPFFRYRLLANIAATNLAARALGKGSAFSAMGVERLPTRTGRFLARRAADLSGLFLARDEGSREKLTRAGASTRADVAADAAFLLKEDEAAASRASRFFAEAFGERQGVVALNPITSHEVACPRADVVRAFVALADTVRAEGKRVLWLPFKTRGIDNDLDVLDDVARASPAMVHDARAPLDLRPAETLAFLRHCEAFAGMRHHGVLLALLAGTRTVAIPYAEKTEHLVAETGIRDQSVPAVALTPDALRRAYAVAKRVDAARSLAPMRARARHNFVRLTGFLDAHGRAP